MGGHLPSEKKKKPMKKSGMKKSGMKKKPMKKKTTVKKVPPGFHRMPDGSIMKGSTHKGGYGGNKKK